MFQSIVLLAKMGQKDKTKPSTFILLKDTTGWRSSDTLYRCQETEQVRAIISQRCSTSLPGECAKGLIACPG